MCIHIYNVTFGHFFLLLLHRVFFRLTYWSLSSLHQSVVFFSGYSVFFSSSLSSFRLRFEISGFVRVGKKKRTNYLFHRSWFFSSSFTRLPMFSIDVVNSLSFEWLFAYTQLDFLSLACALTLRFHLRLVRRQFDFVFNERCLVYHGKKNINWHQHHRHRKNGRSERM